MTRYLVGPVVVLVAVTVVTAAEPVDLVLPADVGRAEAVITVQSLQAHVKFLSDDLLEGRAPASRGGLLGRRYIESVYRGLGLEPGMGEAGFEQSFEMVGLTSHAPSRWTFRANGRELSLERRAQFVAWSGRQQENTALQEAEVVFVGYGITAPEFGWDDFKGVDLQGKVLLILNNDPDWTPDLFEGRRRLYYGRWDYKYENAARQGAVGAIVIHTRPSAGYPWQVVQSSWTGEQFGLPRTGEALQVAAWIVEDAARRLVAMNGHSLDDLVQSARGRDFRPVPLGVTTSLTIRSELRRVSTANVLGLLRGRDPRLRDEVVIYTAHHDHIGIGEPDATGDAIYNGALDNAAGVAQLLAIARAFRRLDRPPRRSVLFLAVAAEEQGLLGSEHYASHPTFPAGRIAANINIDGANIWGRTSDIALIGYGKSSLDGIAAAAAARQDRQLTNEAFPDRGFFYRSDQFNFAKIGVPALYFDVGSRFRGRPDAWGKARIESWEDEHYHQPSDEYGPHWDLSGIVEDARLAFVAGLAVAEQDALPQWNPGDEFEATRLQALGAGSSD